MHIRGEIVIGTAPHRVANGILRLRVIDVSRADAPSAVVAEKEIPGVSVEADDQHVAFELDVPELEPRSSYALEAHLDADGSGETSVGDYRTMEHIEVSSHVGAISVPLRPVG